MSKARNIVRGVKIEEASGTRKCHAHKSHTIKSGEKHLALYNDMGTNRENICLTCAREVLDVAIAHLQNIRQQLYP